MFTDIVEWLSSMVNNDYFCGFIFKSSIVLFIWRDLMLRSRHKLIKDFKKLKKDDMHEAGDIMNKQDEPIRDAWNRDIKAVSKADAVIVTMELGNVPYYNRGY